MAERPEPSVNPIYDEELANDAAARIASAAGNSKPPPKASEGTALSLAQLTSGFSHTLRR
ncbi:hypothetical protein DUNSADRAFT_10717 [Dunaliella salina]|uniref:Encoded protein n=1 Tax=Dunaliella salina TaxID=3046 RepID=A0ABQ7FS08_DUNSA|nr:hypothetical protein DUNSADRAFT_10717 [Dunaliella salina]|eukprot:KAF5825391.1 hypothetical protein DUNSADRAFT_10717 [Dunaliella salina]